MGRKCCVTNCRGNYDFKSKEKVFRLPVDENERKRWLSVIPRDNTPNTKDKVVCERHWPNGYETVMHYGKQRPLKPPLLFSCVKPCLLRTSVPLPRAGVGKLAACGPRDRFMRPAGTCKNFTYCFNLTRYMTKYL